MAEASFTPECYLELLPEGDRDPPQKRVKLESDPIAELGGATEDEEFWFDDNTVILVAGQVKFCVYKEVLASQSEVFKDLFSLPQPPQLSTGDTHEAEDRRRPIVHLYDSPESIRHVLRVCMPPFPQKDFFVATAREPSFEEISACIHIGHKYQMTNLYEQSIAYLKRYYTDNFLEWEQLDTCTPAGFTRTDAIGVVNLARSTGELSILPAALLACTALRGDLVRGFLREDGSRERLSADDLERCVGAIAKIVGTTLAGRLRTLIRKPSPDCTMHHRCKDGLRDLVSGLELRMSRARDPHMRIEDLYEEDERKLCKRCWDLTVKRDLGRRRSFWRHLPELLDVDLEVQAWGTMSTIMM
ncbi:hypothetical protein C8Q80DRAFT_1188230 [Daedaleopsis nitida]|nr:hypothetical protein C8Q80DRAFT_1188230 [Daedaleopsis nitida]